MIIDSSYFKGPIALAQLDQLSVSEKLDTYIEQYEPEFIRKVLGYELSKSFSEAVDEAGSGSDEQLEEKWDNILNGVEFSYRGRQTKFEGITKDIARYVYWHYVKDLSVQQAGIGTVKTKAQNSTVISPIGKMINAWNEMSDSINILWSFLDENKEIYTGWNRGYIDCTYFRHQNQYGI